MADTVRVVRASEPVVVRVDRTVGVRVVRVASPVAVRVTRESTGARVTRVVETRTVRVQRAGVRVVRPAPDVRVRVSRQGPPGPAGAPGTATFQTVAATTVSGHRVVRADDDRVTYASATTASDATADLWLTLQAADADRAVTVHTFGRVSDPSWSWAPGPVWLDTDGHLTQTPPTAPSALFLRQIGTAADPATLFFNPQPAIGLASP